MAGADTENLSACRCLNVQIHPQPVVDARVRANDSEYKSVFVGDEGITITHPQVTLRTRSQGVQVPDSERCDRYVTLSCLLCQTVVYRVLQNIPMDIAGKEGPMLPTDDWAEQETLKSASGWIELHSSCLIGEAVPTARKSSSYSKLFSVVLPSRSSPILTESDSATSYTPASPPVPSHTPGNYLPNLRPIFPPPPFTPSDPVFAHLSALATSKSEALRKDAEEYLAELAKNKVAEIEKTESELRRQAQALWRCFREGVEKVEQERSTRITPTRKDGSNWSGVEPVSKPSPALVSIRDFNPVSSPRRTTSPTFMPRMSSLSVSLATSSFHHPKAQADQGRHSLSHEDSAINHSPRLSPPDLSDLSSSSSSKSYSSLSSRSSKSVKSVRASMDGTTYLEPFRRNMNQANDTATSFRYFTILEADTARTKRKTAEAQGNAGQGAVNRIGDAVTETAEKGTNGSKTDRTNGAGPHSRKSRSNSDDKTEKEVNEVSPKGKRKVTFDIKPDVVIIKRSVDKENGEGEDSEMTGKASEDMIFDLEDEGSDRGISTSSTLLPLNEAPHMPSKPTRTRVASAGLPSSLSSLRPISLPSPSAVRPSRVAETHKDTSQAGGAAQSLSSSQGHPKRTQSSLDNANPEDPEPLDPREAEILKLVAADTPSHRGAWKKDSKAWQLFVRRQGGKGHQSDGLIPEETEDDAFGKYMDDESDSDADSDPQRNSSWAPYKPTEIAASLPISIGPLSPTKETLSLASYQPKASLSNQSGILVPALRVRSKSGSRQVASTAWRKAAYAQRDINRYTDPGPLDFAADEDDDEDDEDEESALASVDKGGRGRQRALKILQVRSEVPASGMWRSLA